MNTDQTQKRKTEIYFKDWGKGQPVVFSHGWPLVRRWEADVFPAQRLSVHRA